MSDNVNFLFDPSMPWLVGKEDETFANWCDRYPGIDDSADPLDPGPGTLDYASNSAFDNGNVNHGSNLRAPANPSFVYSGYNDTNESWQPIDFQAQDQQLGVNTHDFTTPGHLTEPDLGFTANNAALDSFTASAAPIHRAGFPIIDVPAEQSGMHQSHAATPPYIAQHPVAPFSLQAEATSLSAGNFDSSNSSISWTRG